MRCVGIGLHWDELAIGEKFRTVNRTVTEADIVCFINATGMVETLFTDLSFTEHAGVIKGRVAPAALSYTMMEGLLCQSTMQTTGLALLEVEKKVLKPVVAGDTLHVEVEVTDVRPTSKGNRGVVTTVNNVVNQHGEAVITYRAVRLMAGRPVAAEARREPSRAAG